MRYLVTGSAGFIGFHLCKALLEQGNEVIGLDNFFPYYAVVLKEKRHSTLKENPNFTEARIDLVEKENLEQCFSEYKPDLVCHLAAQAGVRYSLVNPFIYQKANLEGFLNILEVCKQYQVKKLVYASSSSVYGKNIEYPYSEKQFVDHPISLYAATKKANELMAHTYSHLYEMPTVGLRFFTVYGPWGRPDMAMWIFADAITASKPIKIFNHGKMERDFTYIDDIISGVKSALQKDTGMYQIFNLGNHRCENIMTVVEILERELGKKADIQFLPIQPGDVPKTTADIDKTQAMLDFQPNTSIETGIPRFIKWFVDHAKLIDQVREAGILG